MTRSAAVTDLLRSREDPEAVAQVVVDALRQGYSSPGELAAVLAPSAARHGLRQGDGVGLLQWFLDLDAENGKGPTARRGRPCSRSVLAVRHRHGGTCAGRRQVCVARVGHLIGDGF